MGDGMEITVLLVILLVALGGGFYVGRRRAAVAMAARAGQCHACGSELGWLSRLKGQTLCPLCEAGQERQQAAARAKLEQEQASALNDYRALLDSLSKPNRPLAGVNARLNELETTAGLTPGEARGMRHGAFRTLMLHILEDDRVSEAEERRIFEIAAIFGLDKTTFSQAAGELLPRLFVAKANDGRLAPVEQRRVLLKAGEVAYEELDDAILLKHETLREWQAGSAGISFRVAKGVRFSTGRTRGRMVEVGTYLAPADVGTLTATSHRVIFVGSKRSIEVAFKKLLSLEVFDDGIRLHSSGRANPPLFRLPNGWGNVVAATVNAAMQQAG
jgi:hypothetical protein